ncbi:MAG: acyl-CoA synthetase [Burkholderiales bacterium]|nr:acyl-CoA synthetase [Burkholderiales bacterium]
MNAPIGQHGVRSIQDVIAIEQVPYRSRGFAETSYEIIRRSADKYSDRVAVRYLVTGKPDEEPLTWTYRELLAGIHRAANAFTGLGLVRESVLSYILPNLPQTHLTLFGGEAAAIVNPINPLLEGDVIGKIAEEAGAELLVVLGPSMGGGSWEKIEPQISRLRKLKAVLQVNRAGSVDSTDGKLSVSASGVPIYDFDILLALQAADALAVSPPQPGDVAAYFHTGGTTGVPKIAIHTHANQAFLASSTELVTDNGVEDVAFGGLPLFHVNALFSAGLMVFGNGGSVVMATPTGFRNPEVIPNFWKIVSRYKITWFSAVPTIYAALLAVPFDDADVSSLRYGICGAAPMPPEIFRNFQDRTGIRLIEGYGLTEATCMSSLNPIFGEKRIGSVGLRIPYQEMKTVVLDEHGTYVRDCAVDESGIVVVRGANVFGGYKQAGANVGVFIADGWLNTGDLGRCDAEGYFWLTGREKDLIIRGGHNIDPSMIENAVMLHPAVSVAAAIGQPDAYSGELACVYVTLKPGSESTAEELRAFAASNIGERAAAPVHVEILDALPLTAVGKIFKPELRRLATERVLSKALADAGIGARVSAVIDVKHGLIATIDSKADAAQVKTVVDMFAVRTQIKTK